MGCTDFDETLRKIKHEWEGRTMKDRTLMSNVLCCLVLDKLEVPETFLEQLKRAHNLSKI